MTEKLYCLRPDVVVEPLVARWHATPHLISPATAALNTAYRHLRVLESYAAMPQVHVSALRDPAMLGGPFIDLGGGHVEDIRALIEWTRKNRNNAIALAEALNACWKMLVREVDGHALASFYGHLPDVLRGLVELVYTPAGSPDIRLNEALLYRSPCYDPALQTAMIRRHASDVRSFALSTPRLDDPEGLHVQIPFADPVYDFLGALRSQPQALPRIAEVLSVGPRQLPLLESFLTEQVPETPRTTGRAGWRYFGHACVLVETAQGRTVLIDPVVAYESGTAPQRFTAADLPPRIDYVAITHNHADHAMLETLLALRWKIGTVLVPAAGGSVVDPSLRLALKAIGFPDVRELSCLEKVEDGDLGITALPFLGEHADLDIRSKAAWLVEAAPLRLLFAADSNNLDPHLYERLRTVIGRIDTLFIGMECKGAPMSWLYGCLLPFTPERSKDQSRRLDGSDSVRALAAIKSLDVARVCIYAMGLEPWLKFVTSIAPDPNSIPIRESEGLIASCRAMGLPAERLYGKAEAISTT